MKFKLSRFSLLGILLCLMACGSEVSTQPSTTVNAGVGGECNTEPEEVWVSAEEAPLTLRELAPGVVLEAVGLNSALKPLAAELDAKAFGRLHFAGYAWALPMMRFDGLEDDQPNENGFWHDATILIELEPGIEPGDIILLEAYQNLMMNTQNDAIVLF